MTYWYELIHRPISIATQPNGYVDKDTTHINRNGFQFGKVAYDRPLTQKEMHDYDLEPVHAAGMIEISMISQSFLNDNKIKITVDIVDYLVDNGMVTVTKNGAWTYINVDELKVIATEKKAELKNIYKKLRNVS